MLKNLKELSPKQKARILSMFIILTVLSFLVWGYAREAYYATEVAFFEPVDTLYVDGEDFTGMANVAVQGADGILHVMKRAGAVFGMLLISLILLVSWKCICIRKKSIVDKIEYRLSIILLVVFTLSTLGIGLLATDFRYVQHVILLVLVPTVSFLLLCVLPLEEAYLRAQMKRQGHSEENI